MPQNNAHSSKSDVFKRDVLRDYALASADLMAQFQRFDESGIISFSIIRGIVGEAGSKGLLWQLKDTAHHLFSADKGASPESPPAGQHLDWAIGFLFHECMIILESSYQMQKYYPAAWDFMQRDEEDFLDEAAMAGMQVSLQGLAAETQAGLTVSIGRVRRLLAAINLLMCAYLAGQKDNRPLARLIYDREDLLRTVFGGLYDGLITGIFGDEPEKLPLEAARSLLESGQAARAGRAAKKALAVRPDCAGAREILDKAAALRQ